MDLQAQACTADTCVHTGLLIGLSCYASHRPAGFEPNAKLLVARLFGVWPVVVVVATQDVKPNEHIRLDYGPEYWVSMESRFRGAVAHGFLRRKGRPEQH